MLTIRSEQLAAFQDITEIAFIRRLMDYIREKYADVAVQLPSNISTVKQLPDELLRTMVCNGVARAREYNFHWESTLTAFVALMFVVAPNFDQHPLIRHALKDSKYPQDERFKMMIRRTSEENWEEVKRRYDANAWGIGEVEA